MPRKSPAVLALEAYLRDAYRTRSTGGAQPETSYYSALRTYFNDVGGRLEPQVWCEINLANRGAGFPDGGFFTEEQLTELNDGSQPTFRAVPSPSRGVLEVKPPREPLDATARGEQVTRYWREYQQVLVTNLRSFVLVSTNREGEAVLLERYSLADTEQEFWLAAESPEATAALHGERLAEFVSRSLKHAIPLSSPQDVAWFMASHAREALVRLESSGSPDLVPLKEALESALGITFEGENGGHFFRSTLVQTLFYGVFSAWIEWQTNQDEQAESVFDWPRGVRALRAPMIRSLLHQTAAPGRLEEVGLSEVLDWTEQMLNRVEWQPFIEAFQGGDAIQYFYEPFVQAFDPELRKAYGVWYTPPEVVEYMVTRVDRTLRDELGIADGLAADNVFVLDPATGTGSYVLSVLRHIHATLVAEGRGAVAAEKLKQIAMTRVFGFEILPASLIVAHLQISLYLQTIGAPLDEGERPAVYLTNSLTGWTTDEAERSLTAFPEFQGERSAAAEIKREKPILVVLGNPPYDAFGGTSPDEERGLIDEYRNGLRARWGVKRIHINNLFARFFRVAERRITATGRGIVCYISPFVYLDDDSFIVMRERFLAEFDRIWIDCTNGSSRQTGKKTPDGRPDPSIFSTDHNPQGIRLGTCIGLFVRKEPHVGNAQVLYRDFWGATKRRDLVRSLTEPGAVEQYRPAAPSTANRFSFRPPASSTEYDAWPSLRELAELPPLQGMLEARKGALFAANRNELEARIKAYLDPAKDPAELLRQFPALSGILSPAAMFNPVTTRARVLGAEVPFDPARVRRYAVRAFDHQWCYYSPTQPLWNRARPILFSQAWEGNVFLVSRRKPAKTTPELPMYATTGLFDDHLFAPDAFGIPFQVRTASQVASRTTQTTLSGGRAEPLPQTSRANLSPAARGYLESLGIRDCDSSLETAAMIWQHALAIGFSPKYLADNWGGIRQGWPRIPLPANAGLLRRSAVLGDKVALLLNPDAEVPGVTHRPTQPYNTIGVVDRVGGGQLSQTAGNLELRKQWGYRNVQGVVMGGQGDARLRDYSEEELASLSHATVETGASRDELLRRLGQKTYDVYLNEVGYWRNIPARVWEYNIGGSQVIKKWLSYRELEVLGRPLQLSEVEHVQATARRIAALILLGIELDEAFESSRAGLYPWPASPDTSMLDEDHEEPPSIQAAPVKKARGRRERATKTRQARAKRRTGKERSK